MIMKFWHKKEFWNKIVVISAGCPAETVAEMEFVEMVIMLSNGVEGQTARGCIFLYLFSLFLVWDKNKGVCDFSTQDISAHETFPLHPDPEITLTLTF